MVTQIMLLLSFVIQVLTTIFVWYLADLIFPSQARLSILDVGQGDAILLTTAQNKHILIDGGPGQNILSPLSGHLPPFDRTIDLIIITHPHADHLDGLLAVLRQYTVRGVLFTNVTYTSTNYTRFLVEARKAGVLLFTARADEDWLLENNLLLDILFPFDDLGKSLFRNINNSSLVFKLIASQDICLFTGDMEKELERILWIYYQNSLQANCLKVAHHGSKTSSSSPFLQFVKPQEMWISVGANNNYKHPDQGTFSRLSALGSVFRTDKVGTITKILLQ